MFCRILHTRRWRNAYDDHPKIRRRWKDRGKESELCPKGKDKAGLDTELEGKVAKEFQGQPYDWNVSREHGLDSGWEFEIPNLYSPDFGASSESRRWDIWVVRKCGFSRLFAHKGERSLSLPISINLSESYEMDLKVSSPLDAAALSSGYTDKGSTSKYGIDAKSRATDAPSHPASDKDQVEDMDCTRVSDATELDVPKLESLPQMSKLDKNDSMAAFFINTREHPIDIATSPTIDFSGIRESKYKSNDSVLRPHELSPYTPKMRRAASDMSIQLEPYSPQKPLNLTGYHTPPSPRHKFSPYNIDELPNPVKATPAILQNRVETSVHDFYENVGPGNQRGPHLSTPTKLRLDTTPTINLHSAPDQSPRKIQDPEMLHHQFGRSKWSPSIRMNASPKLENRASTSSHASANVEPPKKDTQSPHEKTLRDDFFDQFNTAGENIMHERLPSYDTTLHDRFQAYTTSTEDAVKHNVSHSPPSRKTLNLECLLKSINIDTSDEFPYTFSKKETFHYLPKNIECCGIEELVLLMLPKLIYTENECLRLQDVIAKTRSNVGRLIRTIELNPPPIFYDVQNHDRKEARGVREALKTTHVYSVNEAEASVYLRHSDSINAFHRSMAQILPSLQSDEPKIKSHLDKFTKKFKAAKELNETIRENIRNTKRKIEERRLEQESRKAELLKLCNSRHDHLRGLMEENASSQQDINDSSEIDKLNTELKHVQSCINDIDKRYDEIRQFSTRRLRALGREYDIVHATLPWRVLSSDSTQIVFSYMGVMLLIVTREKESGVREIKIRLVDRNRGTIPRDVDSENWITIDALGTHNVSSVISQVEKDLLSPPVLASDVKGAVLIVETLWSYFQRLHFDLELVRSRFDASLVLSNKNSLGIKVNYFHHPDKIRAEIIFWRVIHSYDKAGSHYNLKVECGPLRYTNLASHAEMANHVLHSVHDISARIAELESKLDPGFSIADLIEGIATT